MKIRNIECEWMGIKLNSPFILASLTLLSNTTIDSHSAFLLKALNRGAGAIILPSINPANTNEGESIHKVLNEFRAIESGLRGYMGFTVLGPTDPNILPTTYVIDLANRILSIKKDTIIVGSVAIIGNDGQILNTIKRLIAVGVSGLEINVSCPNVLTHKKTSIFPLRKELLLKIVKITRGRPISLKIGPDVSFEMIKPLLDYINGLTLFNAHIGLVPPELSSSRSPFCISEKWSPTGIYGPQERLITYYKLFQYGKTLSSLKRIDISCVGGILTGEQAAQAILLGAKTVQLSSAIVWHNLSAFALFNDYLCKFLTNSGLNSMDSLVGSAIDLIEESADKAINAYQIKKRRYIMNTVKCRNCKQCMCCDSLCLAFTREQTHEKPYIQESLCSGCGLCEAKCPHKAPTLVC